MAEYSSVVARAMLALQSPSDYRLLDSNCEHLANKIVNNHPISPQIRAIVSLGVVVGIIATMR